MSCCMHEAAGKEQSHQTEIHSVSLQQVAAQMQLVQARLAQQAPAAAKAISAAAVSGLQGHIHQIADGGMLVSSHFAQGLSGDLALSGTLYGIPCELHINVSFDNAAGAITVALSVSKPVQLGPFTWKYSFSDVVRDPSGNIVHASAVSPDPGSSGLVPQDAISLHGINWWCAVKCAATTLLPALVACVPTFAAGPAAYVACLTAKLGAGDAAKIALCIAQKCF